MGAKDPRQMKTAEVAKMARRKGIQDIEHMNKSQMVDALQKSSPSGQAGSARQRSGNRK